MKLYLDNCCFNRPFDDQKQLLIHLETQAKLAIQDAILKGYYQLIWSYILEYENAQNPYVATRNEIAKWHDQAIEVVMASPPILEEARQLMNANIHQKDALHVACALFAKVDYFVTTDRKLLKKLSSLDKIKAVNPITFIEELAL